MQTPISIRAAEQKAFRATLADGLWEVLAGCVMLEFALAPLLTKSLGDFWSSAIFLPFWAVVYLAIRWVRRKVVSPRLGQVTFGPARRKRVRQVILVVVLITAASLLMGMLVMILFSRGTIPPQDGPRLFLQSMGSWPLGILGLSAFCIAGVLLDYPRAYFYGILLFMAPLTGEWLAEHLGTAHHGFPIVFGVISSLMIGLGLVTFFRWLKANPPLDLPGGED
ncbi:MAG TPA: hypothetical protein PKG95_04850 [Anaerolineaceae bacterium]|jgi:hypothetical protein|nr:hypothetical protein [Anaerolineaceae bacterium]